MIQLKGEKISFFSLHVKQRRNIKFNKKQSPLPSYIYECFKTKAS